LTENVRHCCRNPRCRSKLAEPVENPRSAFCARGCHAQFYRKRCMVCEQTMARKTENQRLCGRSKCRAEYEALQRHEMLGRYHVSAKATSDSKNPLNTGTFSPVSSGPAYRIVAGPALTPEQLRLAAVGAPNLAWVPPKPTPGNTALIGPGDAPINVIGGDKFPNTKVVELAPVNAKAAEAEPLPVSAAIQREAAE
jgi:hypothetical protein